MYWLGTALLTNHTMGTLWKACLGNEDVESVCGYVSDEAFATSVRFMYARYLAGQAVVATSVQEKVWLGRDVPHHVDASDLVPLLVRILRGSPGACITSETIESIDLDIKRNLRNPGTAAHEAATTRLQELWRMLADVGVGKLERDAHGHIFLRRYDRASLTKRTLEWLQQNRVPGFMFGIAAAAAGHTLDAGTALRGTNPSLTVKVAEASSPKPMPDSGVANFGMPSPRCRRRI